MFAIETEGLTKTYGGTGGCREISLQVPRGALFGLLGPNGAGKSTLVKMLVSLIHPTEGQARILGKPLGDVDIRRKVGYLPENFRYHDWLTGADLLRLHAALYGLTPEESARRAPEVLRLVGMEEWADRTVGSYSKGMQQRIGLACALLPNPELIFLDEPTSALDPLGRKEVRELLARLRDAGVTVFLNSHLLSELETVCDRIAIIKGGRLIYQGDWRELAAQASRIRAVVAGASQERLAAAVSAAGFPLVSQRSLHAEKDGKAAGMALEELVFTVDAGSPAAPRLVQALVEAGMAVHEVTTQVESLETLFLHFVEGA
ncbi:ATP-binding cassette domain-containing protein [Heliobacterium undosum]|uniref:ATP-binding cassette domain-containing protein n=1 Tax=Heliomicrobium undosum TaxID=121734 RepID=A0A845L428_9FIRM|nr:ABC transporter ATP-binding protein [Heliomicrobium undosum]MZP29919.1 ATP-binding cassette domain-containing protein [Heliomicrobium undosum]